MKESVNPGGYDTFVLPIEVDRSWHFRWEGHWVQGWHRLDSTVSEPGNRILSKAIGHRDAWNYAVWGHLPEGGTCL